ncbi:MAG: class I SAM-dependent methyltransferase [Planctomycetota bacterium]|jgi:SAM-dependent methyltransferase
MDTGEPASAARRLVRRIRRGLHFLRFWRPSGYRASAYWRARHRRFGFDLRGVGNLCRSPAANEEEYARAREVFRALCAEQGVDLPRARMLDIGCGTGFYAQVYRDAGGSDYTGVDITDALFPALRERFPAFRFVRADVTQEALDGTYDLITMIDVTQHIVNGDRFDRALRHVRARLAPDGVALLTSWLSERPRRRTLYEVERPRAAYEAALEGCEIGAPRPFRDKFIFAVRSAPEPSRPEG